MAVAHVTATLIVFAALNGAERTLFALIDALVARLPQRPGTLSVAGPARTPRPTDPPQRATFDVLCRRVHGRRGPP
ncbi:hypothetical protein BJF85_08930 [Saccharomonospora sp. CUA-673]|uniref:hypothetical protein n=1 Tax=Saccharomonospora sp. CUA-673 TaxID=1904969 RepID=UPI00095D4FFA|nr:hypothetical protein [Saccharomonospora sp. CUA-673]OLT38467.1 hypothetical protein BJF85_08930 [Saccharomonospora sp. CUA-673]